MTSGLKYGPLLCTLKEPEKGYLLTYDKNRANALDDALFLSEMNSK